MTERFFYLLEKYLQENLSGNEAKELDDILSKNPPLKEELEEQKRIKEEIKKMQLKNPSGEFWDKYWLRVYNRGERKFAWLLVIIGAVIILSFAAIEAVDQFLKDVQTPLILKIGIAALTAGIVILLVSVVREKFSTYKKDQYKEIQR
jgi:uncharacterized integral membrane protein